MRQKTVVSWTTMITGYSRSGRIDDAKHVFDAMPHRDIVSWNAMLSAYAKHGRVQEARYVFDSMPEKNLASWNAMVSCYSRHIMLDEARQLFDEMPERNLVSWTALIQGYVRLDRMEEALQLFEAMPVRNAVTYTVLVNGFAKRGDLVTARHLFDCMPNRDTVSWNAIVAAYAQNGNMDEAEKLFQSMPDRDEVSWNAMISGYARCKTLDKARYVFDMMPKRNMFSWTSMIAGYAQNEQGEEALKLFMEMRSLSIKPDDWTFATVIDACGCARTLVQGMQIHGSVIKLGFSLDGFICNALITMYAECGDIENAQLMFDEMPCRNVVSWNSLIGGYAQHGRGIEAIQLFNLMMKQGLKPNDVTFVSVLSACSHAGLVELGRLYFDSMQSQYQIEARAEHYCYMVDLLGRAGMLEEAKKLVDSMPIEPTVSVWGSLLSACHFHGHLATAEYAAERLLKLEATMAGPYVTLSNIYAKAARHEEFAKIRRMMKERDIKKEAGLSKIEVKNKVHSFVVDDRSHPMATEIYSVLDWIYKQMEKDPVYSAACSNVAVHDPEKDKETHSTAYHCERLAVCFGLASTPPGTTLHVINNQRMCRDCHNVMKFISRLVGRKLIIGERNRFHRFETGSCSCGDFW